MELSTRERHTATLSRRAHECNYLPAPSLQGGDTGPGESGMSIHRACDWETSRRRRGCSVPACGPASREHCLSSTLSSRGGGLRRWRDPAAGGRGRKAEPEAEAEAEAAGAGGGGGG